MNTINTPGQAAPFSEFTEATGFNANDLFLIASAAGVSKKTKWETIVAALRESVPFPNVIVDVTIDTVLPEIAVSTLVHINASALCRIGVANGATAIGARLFFINTGAEAALILNGDIDDPPATGDGKTIAVVASGDYASFIWNGAGWSIETGRRIAPAAPAFAHSPIYCESLAETGWSSAFVLLYPLKIFRILKKGYYRLSLDYNMAASILSGTWYLKVGRYRGDPSEQVIASGGAGADGYVGQSEFAITREYAAGEILSVYADFAGGSVFGSGQSRVRSVSLWGTVRDSQSPYEIVQISGALVTPVLP